MPGKRRRISFDRRFGTTHARRRDRGRLDHVYVSVRPPVEIAWPDLTLRLETEPWLSTVVVYTPDQAVCVEPQTAWPNALALEAGAAIAAGSVALAAGETLRARLALSWVPPAALR